MSVQNDEIPTMMVLRIAFIHIHPTRIFHLSSFSKKMEEKEKKMNLVLSKFV